MDAIPTQTTLDAASATAPGCAKVFVRDLADGARVESPFVVRDVARKQKRNGEAFLKLQLGDVTGAIEGVVWEEMVADLRALIDTVQDRHLRALLDALLSERSPIWERWRDAPAAKYYHQAYRHGLLEHCLSVAQAVNAVSAAFPGIDRDLAVTGALLHDIGKIEAYAMTGGAIELSDSGRLQGEIPLGYYIVRRAIEDLPGFPPDRAEAVLHIILSHHGMLEHGSPVVPCTREATLVHMIDNLGGRLGSFDRIEKSLGDGERWSGFDRALSGSAFFGARQAA